jgi:hypothetical protein
MAAYPHLRLLPLGGGGEKRASDPGWVTRSVHGTAGPLPTRVREPLILYRFFAVRKSNRHTGAGLYPVSREGSVDQRLWPRPARAVAERGGYWIPASAGMTARVGIVGMHYCAADDLRPYRTGGPWFRFPDRIAPRNAKRTTRNEKPGAQDAGLKRKVPD